MTRNLANLGVKQKHGEGSLTFGAWLGSLCLVDTLPERADHTGTAEWNPSVRRERGTS